MLYYSTFQHLFQVHMGKWVDGQVGVRAVAPEVVVGKRQFIYAHYRPNQGIGLRNRV
jgi:hypothetical protein